MHRDDTLLAVTEATEETIDATQPPSAVLAMDETVASGEGLLSAGRPVLAAAPERGALIGRYVILSKLGAGAMGIVLAAYDPELDRKVALKLLKARSERDGEAARARLQREAQALAKLNHTNVVAVHDVGIHDGQVFVAMEFVEGQTLGEWMKTPKGGNPRPWREVVDVFDAAGRGLAAAHEQGLIHRDFKPDNVMLGDDGRVRVMDFGLARAHEEESRSTLPLNELEAGLQSALDTPLTQTGAIMGTPAYMAPEQFRAMDVTARSDQFGYCVALFEALYGVRPFKADTLAQLAFAVSEGQVVDVPRGVAVPGWLAALVRRGLSPNADDRFADMASLLAALAAGEVRRRRNGVLAVVAVLGLSAASVVAYQQWDESRRVVACEADGRASVDAVWNDAVRARLRDGLLATGAAYAQTTVEKALPYFDAQAESIRAAQTEACLATRVREAWTEDSLERSTWCLDERRMQLEALATEFSNADRNTLQKVITAAAGLSPTKPCLDAAGLQRSPAPPDDRDAVRAVRRSLSKAGALRSAGRFADGLDLATKAVADAVALGWPALLASARIEQGHSLGETGDYPSAEESLEAAYFEAAELGALDVAADAAVELVYSLGVRQARSVDGLRWSRLAQVALTSLQEPQDSLRRAQLDSHLANLHVATGAHQRAKTLFERALALREDALGPEHPAVAATLSGLAIVYAELGAFDQARTLSERALAIDEAVLGPEHPGVAWPLNGLANIHGSMGNYAEAKQLHERALALRERALGPEHPDVAVSLTNLALDNDVLGESELARALYERALAIHEKSLGPDHPDVATTLNGLAGAYFATGRPEDAKAALERAIAIWERALGPDNIELAEPYSNLASLEFANGAYEAARAPYERALTICEKSRGPEHPDVAMYLNNLGFTHAAMGDHAKAKQYYARALPILEQAMGSDHPDIATSLDGLATAALAEGRPADAVPLLERSVSLQERGEAPPEYIAESQFLLARALWNAPTKDGQDRTRARALARQAADAYRSAEGEEEALAEVEAWLLASGE